MTASPNAIDPARIAAHWSRAQKKRKIKADHLPEIRRWRAGLICGRPLDIHLPEAFAFRLADEFPGRVFAHAVSVGCGDGRNEIALLAAGRVARVTAYELSPVRAAAARAQAARRGVGGRLTVVEADYRDAPPPGDVDLAIWKSALHHMPDVDAALGWSFGLLRPGGALMLFEYAGPNRMQFTDEMLALANRIRAALPDAMLEGAPQTVANVPLEWFARNDPSECADSAAIVPALLRRRPDAAVTPVGGVVTGVAFRGLFGAFERLDPDGDLIRPYLLLEERLMRDHVLNVFALARA